MTKMEVFIGGWYNYNGFCAKQKVNSMRIYNRQLSEGEIKVNYEIDKVRFGL